ncbi:MAG: hypothetical protein ABEH43_00575 [Flavobacteriales bacterium]
MLRKRTINTLLISLIPLLSIGQLVKNYEFAAENKAFQKIEEIQEIKEEYSISDSILKDCNKKISIQEVFGIKNIVITTIPDNAEAIDSISTNDELEEKEYDKEYENDSVKTSWSWENDRDTTSASLTHWAGFDLYSSTFLEKGLQPLKDKHEGYDTDIGRSFGFGLNFIEWNINIAENYAGLVTGLGMDFRYFQFDNDRATLNSNSDTTELIKNQNFSFDKNKLKTIYIKAPLLLNFNTAEKRSESFHLAAGIVGRWNIHTKLKQEYDINNKEVKAKVKEDMNIRDFSFSGTVRVGYNRLNLFATYDLLSFYENGKGPNIQPLSIGITLLGW